AAGQHADRQRPRRAPLPADGLESSLVDEVCLGLPLEQEHDARCLLALLGQDLSGPGRAGVRDGDPLLELLVAEVGEEVDGPEIGHRDGCSGHTSRRYWWMSETAIEPSPTALATRLIERARTSPATNTPGTVVSRR